MNIFKSFAEWKIYTIINDENQYGCYFPARIWSLQRLLIKWRVCLCFIDKIMNNRVAFVHPASMPPCVCSWFNVWLFLNAVAWLVCVCVCTFIQADLGLSSGSSLVTAVMSWVLRAWSMEPVCRPSRQNPATGLLAVSLPERTRSSRMSPPSTTPKTSTPSNSWK